jgi:hypothetical protein
MLIEKLPQFRESSTVNLQSSIAFLSAAVVNKIKGPAWPPGLYLDITHGPKLEP